MLSFKEEEVRQACFLLPPPGGPLGGVRGVTRDGALMVPIQRDGFPSVGGGS